MDNDLAQLLRSVVREELAPVNERLERIETEQISMKQDLLDVKQDMQAVKLDQQSMKQNLLDVKQDQQTMKQDLLDLKQDMQAVIQDQELIKRAVLETNERLIRVESILENQHSIIGLLSARSIEQEAQIKRIK